MQTIIFFIKFLSSLYIIDVDKTNFGICRIITNSLSA